MTSFDSISTKFTNVKDSGISEDIPLSLNISNTEINQAGKTVLKYWEKYQNSQFSEEEQKEKEEFSIALYKLQRYRDSDSPILDKFTKLLHQKLNRLNMSDRVIVASRLKRLESIRKKLSKKNNVKLAGMQDLIGVRIVFSTLQDLNEFLNDNSDHCEIRQYECIQNNEIKENNYIEQPKSDGYRSIHQIFKYEVEKKTKKKPNPKTRKIELQLRTQIQHEWATIVEILGSIQKTSFKTGEGEERYKIFLKLTSVLFSIEENLPVISSYSKLTKTQICNKLQEIDKELQIVKSLEALKSIPYIKSEEKKYYLLYLDLENCETSVRSYDDEFKATHEYKQLEEVDAKNTKFDVVLISSVDFKKIKEAFPNYFMSTENFINRFNKLVNDY